MGTTLSIPKEAPLPPILMQQEVDSVWLQPGECFRAETAVLCEAGV